VIGPDWLATGDAACAFDPLASAGITKAVHHGRLAGEAAVAWLAGTPPEAYAATVDREWEAFLAGRRAHYAAVERFRSAPFWARRV
jgi:flavin-dependent dehydrogenase